jgi:DNA-binding PadR family transcriptional regulator
MNEYETARRRIIDKNIDAAILYVLNLNPPITTVYSITLTLRKKFKYSADWARVKYHMTQLIKDGLVESDQKFIPKKRFSHRITKSGKEFLQFYAQMLQTLTILEKPKISPTSRTFISAEPEWWELIPWMGSWNNRMAYSLLPADIKEKIHQAGLV